jgi:hypothetical protein
VLNVHSIRSLTGQQLSGNDKLLITAKTRFTVKVTSIAIAGILRLTLFLFAICFCFPALAARKKVTAVAVGAQSATPVYSSVGNVTYAITLTTANGSAGVQANDALALTWGTAPAGITVSYTPNTAGAYSPATTTTFTLKIAYTATTLPGLYSFTLTNTDGNGGTTTNTTGTFEIDPAAPTVSGGGTGCQGSVTLTASAGLPAGGTYNWYNVSTGGSAVATGSTYTPAVAGTYYASYTEVVISTAPTTPTSGLYLSYPFSGNANDASGNGNNGAVQGAAPLTTDRYNQSNSAYSFNGSSQYISTTTGEPAPGPQNFSISIWFQTSTPGGLLMGYSASKTGAGTQYDRHIYMDNSGYLYFGLYATSSGTANVITSTSTYADGNWHHAVATCSTTNGSCLYVDGALVASSSTMNAPETYTSVGYWRVGYNSLSGWSNTPTDLYFTGSLDDIGVYNTAISASQVYTLYAQTAPSPSR